jgi:HK97 gp10 family phage protein
MARTRAGRIAGSAGVYGVRQATAKLDKLAEKMRIRIERKAVKKAVEPIYDAAIGRVPVGLTGNLAESIRIGTEKQENGRIAGFVRTKAPHAHLVELGFRHWKSKEKVPAQAFLTPAFDENLKQAESIFIQEVNAEMELLGK